MEKFGLKRKSRLFLTVIIVLLLVAFAIFTSTTLPAAAAPGISQTASTFASITETQANNDLVFRHLGEPQTREMKVMVHLKNNQSTASRNLHIQVPLLAKIDSPYEEVVAEKFSLQPVEIIEDARGGRYAVFVVDSVPSGQEKILIISYTLKLYPLAYDFSKKGDNELYPTQIDNLDYYLSPAAKIESKDPKIIATATAVGKTAKSKLEKAELFYKFVIDNVKINISSPYRNKGALSALEHKEGVCEDMASLFVALCRASGIPARIVNGYADTSVEGNGWDVAVGQSLSLKGQRHSWAEFYLEGYGWIPVDPTFGQVRGADNYFGRIPYSSHLAQNYSDQNVKVTYQGSAPSVSWEEKLVNSSNL